MKIVSTLIVTAGCAVLISCGGQESSIKEVQLTNEIDSVSYSLGVNIAGNIKSQGMDDINVNALANAFNDVLEDQSLKIDESTSSQIINTYFQNLQTARAEESKEEGIAFLEENKAREDIVTTESGLQYEILEEGSGPIPNEDDTVVVHYHGTTIEGTVFDSSVERGEPVTFPVKGVIMGWQEALQLMPEGSKWKVYIPSELAYGERGAGRDIGPNETLIFEVELIEIK